MPEPSSSSESLLLLVDGHAYAYRAFHAIRSLSAPDGSPTNAIYGFIKMLGKMRGIVKPTHLAVIWDAGLAVERTSSLPDYKANRPPTPEGLAAQFPQIELWLESVGVPQWSQPGAEADDWIATLAHRAKDLGWKVVIASSDKDFMQLVDDRIGILNPNDKSEKIWAPADVEAKTGVLPHQIVDWLSLIGDSVDNIPGVPGIGVKTATELLKRFGSVEQLLMRSSELKSDRQRSDLMTAAENLRRNQQLIRLLNRLEGGPNPSDLAAREPRRQELADSYRRWGFKGMLAVLGNDFLPGGQANLF